MAEGYEYDDESVRQVDGITRGGLVEIVNNTDHAEAEAYEGERGECVGFEKSNGNTWVMVKMPGMDPVGFKPEDCYRV